MIWAVRIDSGLRVVALDVAVLGLQDAALRIGEVALRLAVGLLFRRRRRLAVLLAPLRYALLFRLRPAPLLLFGGGFGFRFQFGLGLADLLQPFLLVGHPIGHLIATLWAVELVLLCIGRLGRFQPAVDLGGKLRFPLLHALVAHRLVFGRVRLDLGAVERDVPELHQAGLLGKLQHLHEQRGQRLEVPVAELRDRAEVRRVARHDHHEVRTLYRRLGDPARRVDAARIAVQKQRRHQPRVERRLTEPARVAASNRRQIKLLPDQRYDQPRQVVPRHIVLHARRQKLRLVNLPGAKFLAHGPARNQTRPHLTSHYSDRLLVVEI